MKVYAITKGCYSDYHICCIVTTKEQADRAVALYSDRYDKAEIEEYDTNDILTIEDGVSRWDATYDPDTKTICLISKFDGEPLLHGTDIWKTISGKYSILVNARNREHALKVASDAIAKYMAEQEGL